MSFVAELKRRNVFRVAGLYLVGAWLVVQVAGTLLPMFDAPPWVARTIVILLAIAFVPALILAWIYELTPQGLKREAEVPRDQSINREIGSRINHAIIAVLLVALAYFCVDKFVLAPRREAALVQSTTEAAKSSATVTSAIPHKSIAVLPFTDLSPEHDQEYFSDGVSEEILNALAKVKDLKVAGRTSSFYFKGRNEDLRTVGKSLAVAHLLEGSVRKQGDRVRITAQLIQAEDGYRVWSDSYDGDLSDIFELQERIARAITDQLQVVLQGAQKERLVPVATGNAEAYALYLQATGIFNRREGARFPDAVAQLEQAIELDRQFARAHARLASIAAIASIYTTKVSGAALVEEHARRASELDSALGEPHAALAMALQRSRLFAPAREEFERALALEPNDVTGNFWFGICLMQSGYQKRGDAVVDHVLELDPMLPNALLWRGVSYADIGDLGNAGRLLQRAADAKLEFAAYGLSYVAAERGHMEEAVTLLASGLKGVQVDLPDDTATILARGIYGDAEARATALHWIDSYLESEPDPVYGVVVNALLRMDQPARALAISMDRPTSNDSFYLTLLWRPPGHAARALPEFTNYVRALGLTELWDRYGEPDLCRRRAPGDYVCQ